MKSIFPKIVSDSRYQGFESFKQEVVGDFNSLVLDPYCKGPLGFKDQCSVCLSLLKNTEIDSVDEHKYAVDIYPCFCPSSRKTGNTIILDTLSLPHLVCFLTERMCRENDLPFHTIDYMYICGGNLITFSKLEHNYFSSLTINSSALMKLIINLYILLRLLSQIEYKHSVFDIDALRFTDKFHPVIIYFADSSFSWSGKRYVSTGEFVKSSSITMFEDLLYSNFMGFFRVIMGEEKVKLIKSERSLSKKLGRIEKCKDSISLLKALGI